MEKATRQALLIANSKHLDTGLQVLQNVATTEKKAVVQPSYEEQVQKLAKEQEKSQWQDEYEGFGSLTEMIKNTDKIAQKEVNKQEAIKSAKVKLTEKLNSVAKEKENAEKKKQEEAKAAKEKVEKEAKEKAAKEAKEKAAKEAQEKASAANKTQAAKPVEQSKTQVDEDVEESTLEPKLT